MLFCTNCGRYVDENDPICPECGAVLRPEALVAEPYRYRWPVFLISLAVAAAAAFAASFYLDAYLFFFVVPLFFFGWDRSRPLTYILIGVSLGVGIGLIVSWVYRFSGLF